MVVVVLFSRRISEVVSTLCLASHGMGKLPPHVYMCCDDLHVMVGPWLPSLFGVYQRVLAFFTWGQVGVTKV